MDLWIALAFLTWLACGLRTAYLQHARIRGDWELVQNLSHKVSQQLLAQPAGAESASGEKQSVTVPDGGAGKEQEGAADLGSEAQSVGNAAGLGLVPVVAVDRADDLHRHWVRERIGGLLSAPELRGTRLANWVEVLEQAWRVGGQVNSSAFLDAVWNQERDSLRWLRFWSRHAVMLGLVITSFNLARTLGDLKGVFHGVANLSFEDATGKIQLAMAGALEPMGAAFQASFLGLVLTLGLSALADALSKIQDGYIEDLDRFLQGVVIPHFTGRVEDDRKDYMGNVLLRMEGILERMSKQHAEVVGELANLSPSLLESAKTMKGQLSSFSKSLKVLETLSESASRAGAEITRALEEGQRTLQASHDRFVEELGGWLRSSVESQLAEVLRQSESWDAFRGQAATGLGEAGQSMGEIRETSREAHAAMLELSRSLEAAKDQWARTTESLAALPEDFRESLVDASAELVAESVRRHDQQVAELNRQVGDRFSDLVRALGAVIGA